MASPSAPGDPISLVDGALLAFLTDREHRLAEAAPLLGEIGRVVRAGGKRLRPAFCIWGYRAAGGSDDAAIARAAAALELLHTFAIIHDDVMDRSPLRRGEASSYRELAATRGVRGDQERFGSSAAILVGDLAVALADELWWSAGFASERHLAGARVYHAMRAEVIGGQYLDLLAAARGDATPEETRRISVLKSGRYTVERPLQIGAALAGAGEDVAGALGTFGAPLGEAFQIRDDVIGAFGDPAETGKDAYGDIREGKQTLLVALARKTATPEQRAVLDRHLGEDALDDDGAEAIRTVFRETGALDEVLDTIEGLVDAACDALGRAGLPDEAAGALRALAEQVRQAPSSPTTARAEG
ncbi:MAG TPA: polyprenyl synthetase family protein [Actinomycetota bacterium]